MKKTLKKKEFYIDLLLVLSTVLLVFSIFRLGILSYKYVFPIVLVIFIIDILLLIFTNKGYTFKTKKKLSKKELINEQVEFEKKVKKKRNFLCFVTVIVSIIYLVLFFVLLNLYSSMNNLFKNKSTIEYSIIVNKSNGYKNISDLDDKIVGYYEEDKYSDLAEKKLSKKADVEYIGYSSISELKYALRNDDIDSMMIMDSYLNLDKDNDTESETTVLEDEDNTDTEDVKEDNEILEKIEDFDSKTKVLYKFKINIDNSKNTKSIDLEKGSFVVYISGEDSYSDEVNETSRSDVNMLMVVNLKTRNILLLSIPRDYYIKINSKGAYDKLTHISLYGSEEAADSIGSLLDVDVDYYVKFNFTTFMKATEYLLPLDVYSDYDFTTSVYDKTIGDCYTFSKGYNHITNGKMALQFVRARKNFSEGDRQRGVNQSRFLRAVINKASTPSVLLKYNKILDSLEGTFLTNIDNKSIVNIIKYILNHNGKFNVYSLSLDGYDAHRSTYSGGSQALYVMIPNTNTIEKASVAIKAVLNGETPDIEKDASELADKKDVHEVLKAKTNYGTSESNYNYGPKIITPSPTQELPAETNDSKEPEDELNPEQPPTDDSEISPLDDSEQSPSEGEEGTGSTFGNDDSPLLIDDLNNNINP